MKYNYAGEGMGLISTEDNEYQLPPRIARNFMVANSTRTQTDGKTCIG